MLCEGRAAAGGGMCSLSERINRGVVGSPAWRVQGGGTPGASPCRAPGEGEPGMSSRRGVLLLPRRCQALLSPLTRGQTHEQLGGLPPQHLPSAVRPAPPRQQRGQRRPHAAVYGVRSWGPGAGRAVRGARQRRGAKRRGGSPRGHRSAAAAAAAHTKVTRDHRTAVQESRMWEADQPSIEAMAMK